MKDKQINDNFMIKSVSFIISLVMIPFGMSLLIFKKFFSNLIPAMIISLLIFLFSDIGFVIILFYSLLILLVISIFMDYKLIYETFINCYDSFYGGFKFSNIIKYYKKEDERCRVSPIISKNNKKYRVIEYGTYVDPRNIKKLTGFIILKEGGDLINEKGIANEVVNLYLLWRHIYFHPILGKDLKKNNKPFLKFWINFQNKFKENIEKNKKDNYRQIGKIKDEEFIKILKELDDEVIKQHPFVVKKLTLTLEIFDKIYDIFLRPSAEFYQEIYDKIDKIGKISQKENKIWNKRLRTWKNLYKYEKIKIDKLPDPSFKWIGRGIIADIIDHVILKQQIYPIGGATITGLAIEGGKKIRKKTSTFLNKYFRYHKFGIDAIEENIKMNNGLKEVRDNYKRILSSDNLNKIRNFD